MKFVVSWICVVKAISNFHTLLFGRKNVVHTTTRLFSGWWTLIRKDKLLAGWNIYRFTTLMFVIVVGKIILMQTLSRRTCEETCKRCNKKKIWWTFEGFRKAQFENLNNLSSSYITAITGDTRVQLKLGRVYREHVEDYCRTYDLCNWKSTSRYFGSSVCYQTRKQISYCFNGLFNNLVISITN